jgi:NADP-dependent 3-hydroxy acid dehydrogenase YdfG
MKKAIITGASSGLGREIASKLIEKGVAVINLSRTPSKLSVTNIKTDLTKNDDIKKAIEIINKEHQDADVLILCSGVLHWHKVGENLIEEIDSDFATNITGSIKLTDGVISILKKNKGDIAVIGSTSSFICYPASSVYNAAKHAVLGFIKSLQAEYKKDDVRIIGFHPGGFKSQLHIKAGTGLKPENLMDPKDLANLLVFILNLPRNMEISEIIINRKKPV